LHIPRIQVLFAIRGNRPEMDFFMIFHVFTAADLVKKKTCRLDEFRIPKAAHPILEM